MVNNVAAAEVGAVAEWSEALDCKTREKIRKTLQKRSMTVEELGT